MKRKLILTIMVTCAMISVTFMSGCGKESSSNASIQSSASESLLDETSSNVQVPTDMKQPSDEESFNYETIAPNDSISDGKYEKLIDYWNTKEMQDSIAESIKLYSNNDSFTVNILCEGSNIVYQYTLKNQIDDGQKATFAESLDSSMESVGYMFESIVEDVNKVVNEDCSIICRYLNNDGSLLYERKFS